MGQLKLYLLGAPRVELDNTRIDLPRRKVLAILVYVVLSRQTLPRDALAAIFWPASDSKTARASLRRELHALQNAIGAEWLETTRDELALKADADVWSDVEAFRAALESVDQDKAQHDAQAEKTLLDAVTLYQGDFLTGFTLSDCPTFDDWQFFESESLRREYAGALARLVQSLSAQGHYETAINYARRWLAIDPLEEPVHRELMRVYAWAGQQATALRQYEECARILDGELGAAPDEATQALYDAIRTRRFPSYQERAPTSPFHPGTLPSLPTPEPITQTPSQPSTPHNLPAQATSFIGRQEEVGAICQLLLEQAECRLLTLVGPGGIGKTRLALQVAQQLVDNHADAYVDGIFFAGLETVDGGEHLIAALADAVGYGFQGSSAPQEQLMHYLQTKQLLLLLDNFEHLLEQAGLLPVILQSAPGVTMLATSREALGLQEEWLYAVGGFTTPPADATLEDVEQNSAVQLFLQRARRTDSRLALAPEALTQVVRICQLVDGLPLGLELAATWVRTLSLPEIADEIAANLDFLTTTRRVAPERHSSLRTVLEHSWKLLTPAEQDAFCRLTLFTNGFTRQAANRVADASVVILAALVRKSIIHSSRDGRYTMHGLLRHFAAARLNENPALAEAIAEKHSRYFGAFLQTLEDEQLGAAHAAALEQIGQELENIRSGWRWALAHAGYNPENVKLIHRYIEALFQFYDARSRFEEGRAEFQFALDQLNALASTQDVRLVFARLRSRLGWFAFQIGRPTEAKTHLQRSLDLLGELETQKELIFSLNYLGAIHRHLGEYEEARQMLQTSQQLCRERNERFGLTVALNILGQVAYLQEDYAQAQAWCEESLALKQAIGDRRGTTFSLLYLGLVARAQHDYAKAIRLFRESMLISKEYGDRRGIAMGLSNLAEVEALMGHPAQAQALYEECLQIYTDIYNLLGIVT
ncbi:MAG: hypothetical protein DCC55_24645, partial [Chloroflexi bacterium]